MAAVKRGPRILTGTLNSLVAAWLRQYGQSNKLLGLQKSSHRSVELVGHALGVASSRSTQELLQNHLTETTGVSSEQYCLGKPIM